MRAALMVSLCLITILAFGGCGDWQQFLPGTFVLGDGTGVPSGDETPEVEPNNGFTTATAAATSTAATIELAGAISSAIDVDIFDLGPAAAGQRITVAVNHSGTTDLAAALFDAKGRLISYNDDRWWGQDLRPRLAVSLRYNTEHCYLAVASSYQTGSTGTYTASILLEDGSVPATRPQTIYLNFHGAKAVGMPGRAAIDIPAFNAAHIDSAYVGKTAAMVDAIVAVVRADYARFNVNVVSSTESASAPSGSTVIHFGTFDPNLLGLAENVDEYNADLTQQAIVFTDTFGLFMPLEPTVQEMAMAIGNVASHEAGHLLGLEHTEDWSELMDTTAPAQALLDDQDFHTAPLYEAIFPIGDQDAPLLLAAALGWSDLPDARNVDMLADLANTAEHAEGQASAKELPAAGCIPSEGQEAAAVRDAWRLLLYSHRSVQDHVSKDLFAVHFRRAAPH